MKCKKFLKMKVEMKVRGREMNEKYWKERKK
jgi:hypothetical protein